MMGNTEQELQKVKIQLEELREEVEDIKRNTEREVRLLESRLTNAQTIAE